jgi:hypothetical protein
MSVPRTRFGCLGKLAPNPDRLRRQPRLSSFLTSSPIALPAHCDYTAGITSWGMMGNDRIGDCVFAMLGHAIESRTAVATGTPGFVSDEVVIGAYAAVTGYDPATGSGDNGTDLATALDYQQTTGLAGDRIAGYVAIDPTDQIEVEQAIYLFGAVMLGVRLPQSAERQTAEGRPWDLDWFSPIIGGHGIPLVAYGANGPECITWGKNQWMTWRFLSHYADECYAVVDPDWLTRSGQSPTGLDLDGLLAALSQLS